MSSVHPYFQKIKPAMDTFLRAPTVANVKALERELNNLDQMWYHLNAYNVQLLAPLILKLEELESPQTEEVREGTIECIRFVTSKLFIKNVNGLSVTLAILLKQVQDTERATLKSGVSEQLKIAVLKCMAESLKRSNSDVLEEFYTKNATIVIGKVLMMLMDLIEGETYKTLITEALQCLMVCFYVHDEADLNDVVLRNQVADTLYIYLPKIVTVLFKLSIGDDKMGDTIKMTSIRALGRILCIIYEETGGEVVLTEVHIEDFRKLFDHMKLDVPVVEDLFAPKKVNESFEERLKRLQCKGRFNQWFAASSAKLRVIFQKTVILRSHSNKQIRLEYANMCTNLLMKCPNHLKENFVYLLESIVAMSEDEDEQIRQLCEQQLQGLQSSRPQESLFDANAETLFDEHLTKLPRIIMRADDDEQYAELLFVKGLLRNLSHSKLLRLFVVQKNLELFCQCLLSAIDLRLSLDLLNEDYTLRDITTPDVGGFQKMPWRHYKNLNSPRCVALVESICALLGNTPKLNRIFCEFIWEMLTYTKKSLNESLLLWTLMATQQPMVSKKRQALVQMLFIEIVKDEHWHLALQADRASRSKEKPRSWEVSRTPGLFESAMEVRTYDCDSDDDYDPELVVTMADAEYNVMHTCLVLDALGNCAKFYGVQFDRFLFQCLHKVLLKVASSNTIVHQAAMFALTSMQHSLKFSEMSHFIETYTDYITYHLNTILRRSPDSKDAVDILTVVLQLGWRQALPQLDSIFSTIRGECAKAYQLANVNSYLKVFNAFLGHVSGWQTKCQAELNDIPMHIDSEAEVDLLTSWLKAFKMQETVENVNSVEDEASKNIPETNEMNEKEAEESEDDAAKRNLPLYVQMTKEIIDQVLRFVSSKEQAHQINALECLITGVPLLKDYEDELLPLVHSIWQPLVEKFKQKDPLVLNRCFTLLNVLANCAKEFILKRSLDDVMPFLVKFLEASSVTSASKTITAQTQEYKLQLILLRDFPNLIQCMQIDGKHLNDIAEVVSLYLASGQPKQLQEYAVEFFQVLWHYNGPMIYLAVMKKSHLSDYRANAQKIFTHFGINM